MTRSSLAGFLARRGFRRRPSALSRPLRAVEPRVALAAARDEVEVEVAAVGRLVAGEADVAVDAGEVPAGLAADFDVRVAREHPRRQRFQQAFKRPGPGR